jgi:hypothetical protein
MMFLLQQSEWKQCSSGYDSSFSDEMIQYVKFLDSAVPSAKDCMKAMRRNKLESFSLLSM